MSGNLLINPFLMQVVATVPDQVTNLAVDWGNTWEDAGGWWLAITWTVPGNGGSAITGYEWEATNQTFSPTSGSFGPVSGSLADVAMMDGSSDPHDFRLRAVNAIGAGAWSSYVTFQP
jgi:hypothetical protein